jgi:hypothetical protein
LGFVRHRGELGGEGRTAEAVWIAGYCRDDRGVDDRLQRGENALTVSLPDNAKTQTGGDQIGRHCLQIPDKCPIKRDARPRHRAANRSGVARRFAAGGPIIEKGIGPGRTTRREECVALCGGLDPDLGGRAKRSSATVGVN